MIKKVVCPICGTEFETEKNNKRYCCIECKNKAKRERTRRPSKQYEKECALCGKVFTATRYNVKYCCETCQEAGRKLVREEWETKNPEYARNYMREYRRSNING